MCESGKRGVAATLEVFHQGQENRLLCAVRLDAVYDVAGNRANFSWLPPLGSNKGTGTVRATRE